MIWHIVKKDARLLWLPVAILAALKWLNSLLLIKSALDPFMFVERYSWISDGVLPVVELAGLVILVITVIQQDPFPGTTQDWLTRPISRVHWFAAKWLFVLLLGLAPLFVADVAIGLSLHLSWAGVLAASLARTVALLTLVCAPAFLVGLVTRTTAQALVVVGLVGLVLALSFYLLFAQSFAQSGGPIVPNSGYATAAVYVLVVLNLVALAALFYLQVRWRSTARVRWLVALYLCLCSSVIFLPWSWAVAIHHLGSKGAEPSLSMPADGSRPVSYTDAATFGLNLALKKSDREQLWVPLEDTAVVNEGKGMWHIDYVLLHARGQGIDSTVGAAAAIAKDPDSSAKNSRALAFEVPTAFFNAAQAGHARIDVTAFVTSFRAVAHGEAKSFIGGSIDGASRCRLGHVGTGETVFCVSTQPVGTCLPLEARGSELTGSIGAQCARAYLRPLPIWREPYYSVQLPGFFGNDAIGIIAASGAPDPSHIVFANFVPSGHSLRTLEFTLDNAVKTDSAARKAKTVDGVGANARFVMLTSMAMDSHGNVFVVDSSDQVIRKITPQGEVTTLAGKPGEAGEADGAGSEARFRNPRAIAIDGADNLYLLELTAQYIRKITPTGVVTTVEIHGPGEADLQRLGVNNIAVARDGTLYLSRVGASAGIYRVSPNGELLNFVGPEGPILAVPQFEEEE